MNHKNILLSIPVLALIAVGCASTPKTNSELEQARTAVNRAEADPAVIKNAAVELEGAKESLNKAEQAFNAHVDVVDVTHLAYIARQQANTAEARAQEKVALASIDQANAERDRVRLEARTREADNATRAAQNAKQEAAGAKQEAAGAKEDALAAQTRAQQLEDQLNAKKTDRGLVLTLGDVLFDTGKSELKPGAMRTIDQLADFMRENTERTVKIEGFTDSVGSDDYNVSLSERRADSVRQALTSRGIEGTRVIAKGYGKQYAVAGNDTSAGRQQNRRVEVVISDQSGKVPDRS
jgi:outer membrane protein OmpA-like peptidoglycan-associated protein